MPRFDIPNRRVGIEPAPADAQAFGGGSAQAVGELAGAVGGIAKIVSEKRERDDKLNLSLQMADHEIEVSNIRSQVQEEAPDGEGLLELFQDRFTDYETTALESVPERYKDEARLKFASIKKSQFNKALASQSALMADAKTTQFKGQMDVFNNLIKTGDIDYADAMSRANDIADALPASVSESVRANAVDSLLASEMQRGFEQDGFQETLGRYESGEFNEMDPGVADTLIRRARGAASAEVSRDFEIAARDIRSGGQTLVDFDRAISTAMKIGDDDLVNKLSGLAAVETDSYKFARESSTNQLYLVEKLESRKRNQGLNDYEKVELAAYKNHLAYKSGMIDSGRGFEFYQGIGVIPEDASPLPLAPGANGIDAEAFVQVMDEREGYNQTIIMNGDDSVPLMKSSEVEFIRGAIKGMSPGAYSAYLNQLTTAIGPKNIAEVSGLIDKKDDDLAAHMAVSMSDPGLLEKMIMGKDVPMKDIPDSQWDDAWVSSGLGQTGMTPAVQNQAISMAKDVYAYEVGVRGNKNFTTDDAFKQVIGEPVTLSNGQKTAQFRSSEGNLIEPSVIKKAFKMMDDDMFDALGIRPEFMGDRLSAEDFKPWVQLVPYGQNSFMLRDTKSGTDYVYGKRAGDDFAQRIIINIDEFITAADARESEVNSERMSNRVKIRAGRSEN